MRAGLTALLLVLCVGVSAAQSGCLQGHAPTEDCWATELCPGIKAESVCDAVHIDCRTGKDESIELCEDPSWEGGSKLALFDMLL